MRPAVHVKCQLQVLQEMLDMLRDHENNSHAARLEWIVIWLIVIEVGLQLPFSLDGLRVSPLPVSQQTTPATFGRSSTGHRWAVRVCQPLWVRRFPLHHIAETSIGAAETAPLPMLISTVALPSSDSAAMQVGGETWYLNAVSISRVGTL